MRRVSYAVAMSLDGLIAADGKVDWIVHDPEVDFAARLARFDTLLMGRLTYEDALARGGPVTMPGFTTVVVSRTLRPADHPGVTILADDVESQVAALRSRPGKDIWLFGGGSLFRTLLAARLVDEVSVAVIPVLLGGGTPLLPSPADRARLRLLHSHVYPATGIVSLHYTVDGGGITSLDRSS